MWCVYSYPWLRGQPTFHSLSYSLQTSDPSPRVLCSITASLPLRVYVSVGLHFSAMVCLHLMTKSPFLPFAASSGQIITFSPMANWITRKGAQDCVHIWLMQTINVLIKSYKSQSFKQPLSQWRRQYVVTHSYFFFCIFPGLRVPAQHPPLKPFTAGQLWESIPYDPCCKHGKTKLWRAASTFPWTTSPPYFTGNSWLFIWLCHVAFLLFWFKFTQPSWAVCMQVIKVFEVLIKIACRTSPVSRLPVELWSKLPVMLHLSSLPCRKVREYWLCLTDGKLKQSG